MVKNYYRYTLYTPSYIQPAPPKEKPSVAVPAQQLPVTAPEPPPPLQPPLPEVRFIHLRSAQNAPLHLPLESIPELHPLTTALPSLPILSDGNTRSYADWGNTAAVQEKNPSIIYSFCLPKAGRSLLCKTLPHGKKRV